MALSITKNVLCVQIGDSVCVCVCVCVCRGHRLRRAQARMHLKTAKQFSAQYLADGLHCGPVVKKLPANSGDMSLIPGLGRAPGEEMATHPNIFAWEIPWTEEPGGPQSMGSQKSQTQLSD